MTRLLAAATLSLPLLLPGAAAADSVSRAAAWTCDGATCMRYVQQAAALRDADGCNHDTCISVFGTAGGYSAVGYADDDWYGHVDLWGPGMKRHNTGDHSKPTTNGQGRGVGAACAEGWASLGGGRYESVGLPCVDVR